MPKNNVTDLITDQEMAFARLVLSGTMTDRDAAQAAGLNPDTAAYTKAKPRVRDYMLVYRAAMQQQVQEQESDLSRLPRLAVGPAVDKERRKEQRREQVLDRLWELAKLSPETTRNSITGQVKALQMIVAIEGLIPDRRAGSAESKSAPPLPPADIYASAWRRPQQEKTIDPLPDPAPVQEEGEAGLTAPEPAPETPHRPAADAPRPIGPAFDPSESPFTSLFHPSETVPSAPYGPGVGSAPDTRTPFSIRRNPFARRR
jgi:hypothetical protein